jgi:hypothetical protein
MLEVLRAMQEQVVTNQIKADASMETNQEMLAKIEARIEADNEKSEIFCDTLVSRMDTHQERKDGGHGFGGKSRRNAAGTFVL